MAGVGVVVCTVLLLIFSSGIRPEAQVPLRPLWMNPKLETELYNQACGLFLPHELPEGSSYIPQTAVCGTPVVAALARNWPVLSKSTRETFAFLFNRPTMQRTLISRGGHFKIHYNTTGRDSVASADTDLNGIPDYVDEVAATFESIWDLEVTEMGYREPVPDSDGLYDVYIRELSQMRVYGLNYPVSLGDLTTTSYMHIDNNYTDSIYRTSGLDGLHVSAAHEFHHSLQFGYYAVDLTWYHELTATWMEDVAYDDVNDYFQYVPSFFNSPTTSLDYQPSLADPHQYGASVYAHFLAEIYGTNIIRNTWEQLSETTSFSYNIDDMDEVMPGGGFAGVLPGFVVWNYFTGSRSLPGTYPEGEHYTTSDVTTVLPASGVITTGSGVIDHLASEYMQVATSGQTGSLRGTFTLEKDLSWQFLTVLVKDGGIDVLRPVQPSLDVPNAGNYEEIVFIPISTELSGTRFDFDYSISLTAAPNGQTVPLGLQVNGSRTPIVILPREENQATVVASEIAATEGVSWSVTGTSGNIGLSVNGVAELGGFHSDGNSFVLTATGSERGAVEITGTAGGNTRSVIWAVFTQPERVNTPPVFGELVNYTVSEGEMVSFQVSASDVDGDALTVSIETLPNGAAFSEGVFVWTPDFDQAGSYDVVFVADDGKGQTVGAVVIQVDQVDRPATIESFTPPRAVVLGALGQEIDFAVTTSDPDREPVVYAWTVDGVPQESSENVLSMSVLEGTSDIVVTVVVRGASGEQITQRWTVGRTLRGDFNTDGSVNFADFVLFASVFNTRPGDLLYENKYDLNLNEIVDFADFVIFGSYFGLP